VRSTRWWASQRKPSASSARTCRDPRSPPAARETRYVPATRPIRTALAAYVPVLTKNGTHAATTNKNPPSGPAIICCISVTPPTSQPFARSRRARGTTEATIAWLAERNTTSPALTMNSTASSRAIPAHPASRATASAPIAAVRVQSIVIISRRRSTRSTSTPPGSANSSQGSHATPNVADTISGLLVCAATNSGAAIVARPLPRADVVLAAHSFANRPPSGSEAIKRRYLSRASAGEAEVSRSAVTVGPREPVASVVA
jgi:hypothetical protein